jgi:hypothetical protein
MFLRGIWELEPLGFGPVEEVSGAGYFDVPPPIAEISEIATVLLSDYVPEREILRVEGTLRQDWIIGEQLPVQPIGGLEREKRFVVSTLATSDRLVLGIQWTSRVRILERHEVVCSDACPDDVVLFGTLELNKIERGALPMNPVVGSALRKEPGFISSG